VHLRLGGFTIRIDWTEPDLRGLRVVPASASAPFVVGAAPADVTIAIVVDTPRDDTALECVFDSGGPWRLYRHPDGFLFRFFAPRAGAVPYKTAQFTPDFSTGLVTLNPEFFAGADAVDPLEYPLDELLVIHLLADRRGIEVHGCGLVDSDSTGYLFVGQSGAGKSTMARLWAEKGAAAILSDDRVVLREHDEGLWMYGTPWHGEAPLASPRRSRIARLLFLRHAARNEVVEVPRADAVARLFAASFPPFHDRRALAFCLEFLDALVGRVRCAELRFAPSTDVIAFLRAHPPR
jgi:hypothetical protein